MSETDSDMFEPFSKWLGQNRFFIYVSTRMDLIQSVLDTAGSGAHQKIFSLYLDHFKMFTILLDHFKNSSCCIMFQNLNMRLASSFDGITIFSKNLEFNALMCSGSLM